MDNSMNNLEDEEEHAAMIKMRFQSKEQDFDFYNKYAKEKGFSIRKDYSRRDVSADKIIHRRFICSREGYRKEIYMDTANRTREPRALSRCGCESLLFKIKHDKVKGDWYVMRFVSKHKHPLCKPDEVPFLRSHRRMT